MSFQRWKTPGRTTESDQRRRVARFPRRGKRALRYHHPDPQVEGHPRIVGGMAGGYRPEDGRIIE